MIHIDKFNILFYKILSVVIPTTEAMGETMTDDGQPQGNGEAPPPPHPIDLLFRTTRCTHCGSPKAQINDLTSTITCPDCGVTEGGSKARQDSPSSPQGFQPLGGTDACDWGRTKYPRSNLGDLF
ncbi:hypothetical protein KW786_02255 [Candidatus Parcubacteria bacterium]|nr:hypothetical protein [Candidatus Parcubacteria bacterium]